MSLKNTKLSHCAAAKVDLNHNFTTSRALKLLLADLTHFNAIESPWFDKMDDISERLFTAKPAPAVGAKQWF